MKFKTIALWVLVWLVGYVSRLWFSPEFMNTGDDICRYANILLRLAKEVGVSSVQPFSFVFERGLPGYPLFSLPSFLFSGDVWWSLRASNIFAASLIPVLLGIGLQMLGHTKAARFAVVGLIVNPQLWGYGSRSGSDCTSALFLMGGLLAYFLLLQRKSLKWMLVSSFAFSFASITRPEPTVVFFVILLLECHRLWKSHRLFLLLAWIPIPLVALLFLWKSGFLVPYLQSRLELQSMGSDFVREFLWNVVTFLRFETPVVWVAFPFAFLAWKNRAKIQFEVGTLVLCVFVLLATILCVRIPELKRYPIPITILLTWLASLWLGQCEALIPAQSSSRRMVVILFVWGMLTCNLGLTLFLSSQWDDYHRLRRACVEYCCRNNGSKTIRIWGLIDKAEAELSSYEFNQVVQGASRAEDADFIILVGRSYDRYRDQNESELMFQSFYHSAPSPSSHYLAFKGMSWDRMLEMRIYRPLDPSKKNPQQAMEDRVVSEFDWVGWAIARRGLNRLGFLKDLNRF